MLGRTSLLLAHIELPPLRNQRNVDGLIPAVGILEPRYGSEILVAMTGNHQVHQDYLVALYKELK